MIKYLVLRPIRDDEGFFLPQILRAVKHILNILNHMIVKIIIAVKSTIAILVDQFKKVSKTYHIHSYNGLKVIMIHVRSPALHLLCASGIPDTKRQIFILHVQDHLPDVTLFYLNAE